MKFLQSQAGELPPAEPGSVCRWGPALAVAVFLACVAVGCQSQGTSSPPAMSPPPDPGTADYATNLLHEGDVVSITFLYASNLDAVQKITLDGQLNLESVGTVKAAAGRRLTCKRN